MNNKKEPPNSAVTLRKRAKVLLTGQMKMSAGTVPENVSDLIHELQTHQVELELQNQELRQFQQDLLQSRQEYSDLYNMAPSGYLTLNKKGLIIRLNCRTAELLGGQREHLVNQSFIDYIAIPDRDTFFLWMRKVRNTGKPESCVLRFESLNDELIIKLRGYISLAAGQPQQFIVTLTDITEQVMANETILMLSQAIEQSPVGVVITDTHTNIEYVNPAFGHITGYPPEEVIGRDIRTLCPGENQNIPSLEPWNSLSKDSAWQGEVENKRKNGESFWERISVSPVVDKYGIVKHFLGVREDITVRKHQEQRILHQARFDSLTGLPNRFLALDRLSQLMIDAERNRQCVVVLFLDLDDFKKVNDTLGHEVGDHLLVAAADRLRHSVRHGDTIARLGGDEFIMLLGSLTSPADALPVLEGILREFRKVYHLNGHDLLLTSSIGIAIYPEDGEDSKKLLRNADLAMYHAKMKGGDTYTFFTDEMNRQVARRISLEEKLHGALARKELRIFYQPQINLQSGGVIGAEALLRWHNDVLGEVSPAEFIPVAEQTGLILSLGKFVLEQSLQTFVRWQQDVCPEFRVAVNLSPRQLRDLDLPVFVEHTLNQTGFLKTALELEITESILISSYPNTLETIEALDKLGVSISMDDFGTGYSSLNNLRKYPFDSIKIDRNYIVSREHGAADWELVNAIITLGHSLNLKIVAEGVETEDQYNYLKSIGCDYAQGHYFGKAMSAGDLLNWMSEAGNQGVSEENRAD